MPTQRVIDENGYLTVKGNPISSFGIFDYSAAQLGLPGDPGRIVKVYRPEEEINNPETINSFKNVPFIIEHAMLSGDEDEDGEAEKQGIVAPEEKGMDGILTGNVYYERPWMRGDLKVFSRKARKAIDKGMIDLSLGYGCKFLPQSGTWNGQPYEAIQVDMCGNHIALVPEGRVPGARVLDAKVFDSSTGKVTILKSTTFNGHGVTNLGDGKYVVTESTTLKGEVMKRNSKRKAAMDGAVQQLLQLIPALKEFLEQEAQEPEHQSSGAEGAEGQGATAGDPGAEGTGASAEQATGEGSEDNGEGAGEGEDADISGLITQIEDCLAQLKSMAGQDEGENDEGKPGAQGTGTDAVEGLQEEGENRGPTAGTGDEGEGREGAENDNGGKASPGPKGGLNATAGDAAVRALYRDSAAKNRLYNGISQVVGAFDCAVMDARQVAAYGVKKLGLKNVKTGQEIAAVDLYLQGLKAGKKDTSSRASARVGDGKEQGGFVAPKRGTGDAKLDSYLAGK